MSPDHHTRLWTTFPGLVAIYLLLLLLIAGLATPLAPPLAASASPARVVQARQPLPPTIDLDAVAEQTAALHRANGGATVNLYLGDLAGQPLHVVVVYPEIGEAVPGADVAPTRLRQFIATHLPLLTDPRNNVGTWFNPADGHTYLEVSTALADRDHAIALGQQYNQIGVFDLSQMAMIELGGSGEPPANLPPLDQRLPPIPAELAPVR